MSDNKVEFSSANLDDYLKELAKEYRRISKMPAEVVLVGGASILANYGFREKTYDIDASVTAESAMKDAANIVGDKLGLPNGWFNSDFKNTTSFTPKIYQFSVYYKTFSNIVQFRTITGAHLIAMKLRASRDYKCDLSDVAQIVLAHQDRGDPIFYGSIIKAVIDLYDTADCLSKKATDFLLEVYETDNLPRLVEKRKQYEDDCLSHFDEILKKHSTLKTDNLDDVLESFGVKKKKQVGYNDDE